VLTGHSSAADRRAAECGYLNSQQLTERERAHWTFFRSWSKSRRMWLPKFTVAYWTGTCSLDILPQLIEEPQNVVTLIHSSLLNGNVDILPQLTEKPQNVVTLINSSLLNGNVLTGHSSAADRRAAEYGYLNSQQLTERELAHWTFFRSWPQSRRMWLPKFTAAYWTGTCLQDVSPQLAEEQQNCIILIKSSLLNGNMLAGRTSRLA